MNSLANNKQKLAAAIAAVSTYIKTEEEAMMAMAAVQVDQNRRPSAPPNHWGMSGRQAMMQHRNLMQLKAFHLMIPR